MRWYWGVFRVVTGHCWGCSFFVWGRKDCFPGADGSTIGSTIKTIPIYDDNGQSLSEGSTGVKLIDITTSGVLNGNISQVYAIKNSMTYIYATTSPSDWYTDSEIYQNNALWGDKGEKSTYDPCPKSWRVPTDASKTYGDFSEELFTTSGSTTNVINGRIYNKMTWFPTVGRRIHSSGALNYVGNGGYYWSSSIIDASSRNLHFYINGVNTSGAYYRANGFSVRCVQE